MSFAPDQAQKNRDDDRANMMAFMLRNEPGRAYIWAILELAGVFRTSFSGEQPHVTSFNEGQRNIGLYLLADVLAFDANALTLMQAEDTERQKRYHVRSPERDDEL